MRKIVLLILIFLSINIEAQTDIRPANIEIPILVYDNSGNPESSQLLLCGIDSMATDSIDTLLGEYWLFCAPDYIRSGSDCPPHDHFGAALNIPTPPPPGTFLWGSFKDFRFGTIPYSGTKTYEIYCLTYNIATAVFYSWVFPEGVTGLLEFWTSGGNQYYQMPDSGTFSPPHFQQYSMVRVILTYQNVIPVELNSFQAEISNSNVMLNWSTATEINNSGFKILRKAQNDNEWEKIGFVPGFGTTTEPKSYSFVDNGVTTGTYKYRLKQIDFDGSFEYSNEIEVTVDYTPKEFVLYQNYPNPFNPTTKIKYTIPITDNPLPGGARGGLVTLKVYDVLGNEVATLVNEEKQPGVYEVEFDASNLSSGIYFYQLKAGNFIDTKKIILMK